MLVDCHVHLNNYHEGQAHPTEHQYRELLAKMDERGVDHAVVITSYLISDDRPSVDRVLDVVRGNPRMTVVEGLRWRGRERTDLFEMEERIKRGEVKGIKLYPGYEPYAINDPSLEYVYRLAEKHKVPVMIHTGDTYSKTAKLRYAHPLLVDDVATDFPAVKFVMCHLGNPWFRDAAEVIYKNDNVYADISGLVMGEMKYEFERYVLRQVKDMVMHMGADTKQLMYGSDWPLVRMGPYLDFLKNLKVTKEQMECIRWKTACQVFGIQPREDTPDGDGGRSARAFEAHHEGDASSGRAGTEKKM